MAVADFTLCSARNANGHHYDHSYIQTQQWACVGAACRRDFRMCQLCKHLLIIALAASLWGQPGAAKGTIAGDEVSGTWFLPSELWARTSEYAALAYGHVTRQLIQSQSPIPPLYAARSPSPPTYPPPGPPADLLSPACYLQSAPSRANLSEPGTIAVLASGVFPAAFSFPMTAAGSDCGCTASPYSLVWGADVGLASGRYHAFRITHRQLPWVSTQPLSGVVSALVIKLDTSTAAACYGLDSSVKVKPGNLGQSFEAGVLFRSDDPRVGGDVPVPAFIGGSAFAAAVELTMPLSELRNQLNAGYLANSSAEDPLVNGVFLLRGCINGNATLQELCYRRGPGDSLNCLVAYVLQNSAAPTTRPPSPMPPSPVPPSPMPPSPMPPSTMPPSPVPPSPVPPSPVPLSPVPPSPVPLSPPSPPSPWPSPAARQQPFPKPPPFPRPPPRPPSPPTRQSPSPPPFRLLHSPPLPSLKPPPLPRLSPPRQSLLLELSRPRPPVPRTSPPPVLAPPKAQPPPLNAASPQDKRRLQQEMSSAAIQSQTPAPPSSPPPARLPPLPRRPPSPRRPPPVRAPGGAPRRPLPPPPNLSMSRPFAVTVCSSRFELDKQLASSQATPAHFPHTPRPPKSSSPKVPSPKPPGPRRPPQPGQQPTSSNSDSFKIGCRVTKFGIVTVADDSEQFPFGVFNSQLCSCDHAPYELRFGRDITYEGRKYHTFRLLPKDCDEHVVINRMPVCNATRNVVNKIAFRMELSAMPCFVSDDGPMLPIDQGRTYRYARFWSSSEPKGPGNWLSVRVGYTYTEDKHIEVFIYGLKYSYTDGFFMLLQCPGFTFSSMCKNAEYGSCLYSFVDTPGHRFVSVCRVQGLE